MTESLESILSMLCVEGERGGQAVVMCSDKEGVGTLVLAKLVNSGVNTFLVNLESDGDMLSSSPQIPLKIY